MKRLILTVLTGAMLMVATSAMALTIDTGLGAIEVGGIDDLMAYKVLDNSSIADENAWAAPIVWNIDKVVVNFTTQTDMPDKGPSPWLETSQAGVYAYALSGIQDYFILKTGNTWKDNSKPNKGIVDPAPPADQQYEHYLYRNNVEDAWAVVNLADMFGNNLQEFMDNFEVNNGKISHITTGEGTPVPEPGTMMLLGVGMFGLAIFGKRRMNR